MIVVCKKEVMGNRGDVLYCKDKEYKIEWSGPKSVVFKDELGCIRNFIIDDKAFFKQHFKLIEESETIEHK